MRTLALVLAASLVLAACTPAGPVAIGSPSGSVHPPTPSPSPSQPAPPAVSVVVRGVTVNLCAGCVWFARAHGVGLKALVRQALSRIASRLPSVKTRVDVVLLRGVGPPAGVGAYTEWTTGHVHVRLYASTPDPATALRTWLPFTLAHELDHAVRVLRGPGIGGTLLEWLVAEGMADRFASEAFPSVPPSAGDHALTPRQTARLWTRARPQLRGFQTIARLRGWFFGRAGIPRWAGYTIGYDIVSAYLERNPGTAAEDLVTVPAEEILRGSDFKP